MPKIRFANLQGPVWEHILQRVAVRSITLSELQRLKKWVDTETPRTRWRLVQRLGSFILCGTGEFPKTVLKKGMRPYGKPL